jgi:hypothetical protein
MTLLCLQVHGGYSEKYLNQHQYLAFGRFHTLEPVIYSADEITDEDNWTKEPQNVVAAYMKNAATPKAAEPTWEQKLKGIIERTGWLDELLKIKGQEFLLKNTTPTNVDEALKLLKTSFFIDRAVTLINSALHNAKKQGAKATLTMLQLQFDNLFKKITKEYVPTLNKRQRKEFEQIFNTDGISSLGIDLANTLGAEVIQKLQELYPATR